MEAEETRKELESLKGEQARGRQANIRLMLIIIKDICDRDQLLARREQEIMDAKKQVQMFRGELARCRAAPGHNCFTSLTL